MNLTEDRYSKFALVREMMETPRVIAEIDTASLKEAAEQIHAAGRLFLTGEGSSRIFPAKNVMRLARRKGVDLEIATDGGRQSAEYDLARYVVFGASNSGRTKEIIELFQRLGKAGHVNLLALTANRDTALEALATQTFVLGCGKEDAVAATKSVVEQALVYQAILGHIAGADIGPELSGLADKVQTALTVPVPAEMTEAVAAAPTIHFAGYNDGVAEELTLKTNEITRKKSDFLEGTYAVHGIEEVMNADDVVIVVDPIECEEDKFREVLVDGVGLKVFAIASRKTSFPTLQIPDAGELSTSVQLAAGWNVLVDVGLALGINLDKPERARKVGNEMVG